jgi:hypothetical protein
MVLLNAREAFKHKPLDRSLTTACASCLPADADGPTPISRRPGEPAFLTVGWVEQTVVPVGLRSQD